MSHTVPVQVAAIHRRWITPLTLTTCLVAWVVLLALHDALPGPVLFIAGGCVVCLYSSLQHEAVHGGLARSRRWNQWLASLPLTLFTPWRRYRDTHIRHHRTALLTHPSEDPESFFFSEAQWVRMPAAARALLLANQTLIGRLVIGPFIHTFLWLRSELSRIRAGEAGVAASWCWHLAGVIVLLVCLVHVFDMSIPVYLLCFVWPGMSLLLLRSFSEHQAASVAAHRTMIVEGSCISRLLFLNNNLHWLHHAYPAMPWYELWPLYRARRDTSEIEAVCVCRGYGSLFRRYALTPVASPCHPGFGTGEADQ